MPAKSKHAIHSTRTTIFTVLAALVAVVAISIIVITSKTFQLFSPAVTRVNTSEKVVALTFDDGPLDSHTDEVLETLDQYGVKATFFLIGKEIAAHPGAARQIVRAGHEIGNHGYTHRSLVFSSYEQIGREVEATDEAIRSIGYSGVIHFRPPYGHKFILLPYYLSTHERTTILWNLSPDDHYKKAEDMSAYVKGNIVPGSIIIMHVMEDHRAEQRKSLDQFIPALQKQGYTFVTVSELLSYR
jgi:chitin deacetylase